MNDRLRRRLNPSRYTQHPAATRSLSVPFSSATSVQFWAAANNRQQIGRKKALRGISESRKLLSLLNEPGGARTHDLRIKSLGRKGPKYWKNQYGIWVYVGFSRIRAPPIREFPVPKLSTAVENVTKAAGENVTPGRGDEPHVVVASFAFLLLRFRGEGFGTSSEARRALESSV